MNGRLDPFSGVVDARVGASGANDGIGGGCDSIGVLKNMLEGKTEIPAANGVEPGGVGMAMQRIVGDSIMPRDIRRAVPVDEGFLDGVAVGVAADSALAGVAGKVWPVGKRL